MSTTTLAIILAGGVGKRLEPLTRDRVKPAVPFGGIYRLIDFTLSNCLNSHIRHVCVLTQYKSLSLERHIRHGWSFLPHMLGEFIQVLSPQQRVGTLWYLGTADAVYQNIYSIEQADPDYVLVLSGDHIYKMNYREMIKAHIEKKVAVTVGAIPVPLTTARSLGIISVDHNNLITSFREKPDNPEPIPGKPDMALASMGIYIFNTKLLKSALKEDSKDKNSSHDFGKDILPKLIKKEPTFAYHFVDENRKKQLYWRDVGTIDAFWEANMDLISVDPIFNLYDTKWPISTYNQPGPPAKFVFSELNCKTHDGRAGLALDSLISNGCIISGGQVIRSILSPNVRINEKARVEDSIIFEGAQIGAGSQLYRTIVDKHVKIAPGTVIGKDSARDAKNYMVSEGGIVVIPRREKIKTKKGSHKG